AIAQRRNPSLLERAASGSQEPTSAMFYNDQPPHMILYQGLALRALGRIDEANARFQKLIDYGNAHMNDVVTIDYFAVSLPEFLVFDEDLTARNKIHCNYVIGLGYLGLGEVAKSRKALQAVLSADPSHFGATFHLAGVPLANPAVAR